MSPLLNWPCACVSWNRDAFYFNVVTEYLYNKMKYNWTCIFVFIFILFSFNFTVDICAVINHLSSIFWQTGFVFNKYYFWCELFCADLKKTKQTFVRFCKIITTAIVVVILNYFIVVPTRYKYKKHIWPPVTQPFI